MNSNARHPEPLIASEDGAVAVTTAFLLIALLLFAGLIVDLGRLRVDRSVDQLVSDSAVTAASGELIEGGAYQACVTAMTYALRNLSLPEATIQTALTEADSVCASKFPSTFSCVNPVPPDPSDSTDTGTPGTTPDPATIEVAEYLLTFVYPVPDDSDLMTFQTQIATKDEGEPCLRVGVAVTRANEYILGGVAGFGGSTTTVSAVARSYVADEDDLFASLVVLDRLGCETLRTDGTNAIIDVKSFVDEADNDKLYPGTIAVDTAPPPPDSCNNNSRVFDPNEGQIRADEDGHIFSFGLGAGGSSPDDIYDPAVVPTNLSHDPEPRPVMITRAPIDDRYNCGAVNTDAEYHPVSTWLPSTFRQSTLACGSSAGTPASELPPPYIEELYEFVSDATAQSSFADLGFRVYPQDATEACNNVNIPATMTETRWYFDCPGGVTIRNGSSVTIDEAELVVFAGPVGVNGGSTPPGVLSISGAPGEDATVVVWSGDVGINGEIFLERAMLYLNEGRLSKSGGGTLSFVAPEGAADCVDETANGNVWPAAECFEDLALWQNGYGTQPSDRFDLGGNGGLTVVGTVFVPNARVDVAGGSGSDLTNAQFFGWSFNYSGNGVLTLIPNPNRGTPLPAYASQLIR